MFDLDLEIDIIYREILLSKSQLNVKTVARPISPLISFPSSPLF